MTYHSVLALFGPEIPIIKTRKNRSPLTVDVLSNIKPRNISLRGVHGEYLKANTAYCFGCEQGLSHADWTKRLSTVLKGAGCPSCRVTHIKPLLSAEVTASLKLREITLRGTHGDTVGVCSQQTFGCERVHDHTDWSTRLDKVLKGTGCPACAGNSSPLTVNVVAALELRQIILRGTYGKRLKLNAIYSFGCTKDLMHRDWNTSLKSVIKGTGCPDCANQSPLTAEIRAILRSRKIILRGKHGKRVKTTDRHTFGCRRRRGHADWKTALHNVLRGSGCPACALDRKRGPRVR